MKKNRMPFQSEKQRRYCYYLKSQGKTPSWCKTMFEHSNPCWTGFEQVGFKMKKGRKVPNCVMKK